MKLSQDRIMEIVTMTRRQMLKASGAAALSATLPFAVMSGCASRKMNYRLDKTLKRLSTDDELLAMSVMRPDKTLSEMNLKPDEQKLVRERLDLIKRVGMGLAFELMREQKSLRPVLLNTPNMNELIFKSESKLQDTLTFEEAAKIDNLKLTLDSISEVVLSFEPPMDAGDFLSVVDIPNQASGDIVRDDVDFVCETDQGCGNAGCVDSGCGDKGCTNGGCGNLGCDDGGCDNGSCTNTFCDNTGSCNDDDCTNDYTCEVPGSIPDSFYVDLADRLESALDQGPEMGFLVRINDHSIRGATFLDYGKLNQTLRRIHQPALHRSRTVKPSDKRTTP